MTRRSSSKWAPADIDDGTPSERPGRLINYGVSIGHIPVRMAVMQRPGTFSADRMLVPTGQATSGRRSRRWPAGIEDGLEAGRRQHGRGFPYTPAATQRGTSRSVSRGAGRNRVPVHVHIRRGVAGLDEALELAGEAKAPRCTSSTSEQRRARPRRRGVLKMIANARAQGPRRHNRGVSVHSGHDRNPVGESRRVPGCARRQTCRSWNGRGPESD